MRHVSRDLSHSTILPSVVWLNPAQSKKMSIYNLQRGLVSLRCVVILSKQQPLLAALGVHSLVLKVLKTVVKRLELNPLIFGFE